MKTLISLLSCDIKNESGMWKSTELNLCRVCAAALLFEEHPDSYILSQGGLAAHDRPSLASVMQSELVALGVPSERIIIEDHSQKTVHQLLELFSFALKQLPEKILIISNEWHLPRIEAMIECVDDLSLLKGFAIEFVAAEKILIKNDPEFWKPKLAAIYANRDVKRAIEMEKAGVIQIRNGTYKFS